MLIEIDSHGGLPIYRQVMDQIRNQIMTGRLKEGEQLESVKNLSARLKVNPMTISKAYSFLVEEGIVERRRGVGLFVDHIRKDTKTRIKTRMVEEILKKAAALAVQTGVSQDKALKLFAKHYQKFQSQKGSASNE